MTTFEFYTDSYLSGREAVLDAASFPFWERKASHEVQLRTFGRIDESGTVPDEVQGCVCELAEILFTQDALRRKSAGIASERVGEYSISYQAPRGASEEEKEINRVIREWLSDTGLLYCGVT